MQFNFTLVFIFEILRLMIFRRYQLENVKWNNDIDINICPLSKDDEHYRMISDSVAKHKEVLQ